VFLGSWNRVEEFFTVGFREAFGFRDEVVEEA